MNNEESTEFFDMMIKRKEYLFPDEIRPDTPLTMFIRKEKHHLIPEFDYNSLNMSTEPYLPEKEDKELIQLIDQMDDYIAEGVEYKEWENHYFSKRNSSSR